MKVLWKGWALMNKNGLLSDGAYPLLRQEAPTESFMRGLLPEYEYKPVAIAIIERNDDLENRHILARKRQVSALRMREAGKTLKEIGLHFGVTSERARQLIHSGQYYISNMAIKGCVKDSSNCVASFGDSKFRYCGMHDTKMWCPF